MPRKPEDVPSIADSVADMETISLQYRQRVFEDVASRCYAAYRAAQKSSNVQEDADKALLDAAYFTDMLTRPDLADYVATLHDKLATELQAQAQRLRMPIRA